MTAELEFEEGAQEGFEEGVGGEHRDPASAVRLEQSVPLVISIARGERARRAGARRGWLVRPLAGELDVRVQARRGVRGGRSSVLVRLNLYFQSLEAGRVGC